MVYKVNVSQVLVTILNTDPFRLTVSVVGVAEICIPSRRADATKLQGESPRPGAQQRGHRRLIGEVSSSSFAI